jgi:hypothetical protein
MKVNPALFFSKKLKSIKILNIKKTQKQTSKHLRQCGISNVSFTSFKSLTLNLLTTTIFAPPSNARIWQMGFNSAFKGLQAHTISSLNKISL